MRSSRYAFFAIASPLSACLSASQRRKWFEQKKRLRPKVPIGTAVIPESIKRQYAYLRL